MCGLHLDDLKPQFYFFFGTIVQYYSGEFMSRNVMHTDVLTYEDDYLMRFSFIFILTLSNVENICGTKM